MNDFLERINQLKFYLLAANILLVVLLIFFSNSGILPLQNFGDFFFLAFIAFAFALYRPGWSYLFFVGTIMLENVNLAPASMGLAIRPYQLIGALTLLAIAVRYMTRRLGFDLPKLSKHDWLPAYFAAAGFLSALAAADKISAVQQSLVAATFVAFYFLTKIFIRDLIDLKKIAPFFISSSLAVVIYGIWQNNAFSRGWEHFESMPGRPNATFAEPDWLGIFLVLLVTIFYSLIFGLRIFSSDNKRIHRFKLIYLHCCLALVYVLLIITVSRSAWIGVFIVTVLYLFSLLSNLKFHPKNWKFEPFIISKIWILISFLAAIAVVYLYGLTDFHLFSRFESTGTGFQKITVSCQRDIRLPEKIGTTDELIVFGCRHINLEEINQEVQAGNFVKETSRPDPNIDIRRDIYGKTWSAIRSHPIIGIGWGNISKILGTDKSGTSLNASNIFLEIWLGAGLAGLLIFLSFWVYALLMGIRAFHSVDQQIKTYGMFLILGLFAILIPNLFNSGIFLGFLWLFLGSIIKINDKYV